MDRRFKINDIIELHPKTRPFGADTGAKAICKGYDENYIAIKWIDERHNSQQDGNYNEDDFILSIKIEKVIKEYGIVNFMRQINVKV